MVALVVYPGLDAGWQRGRRGRPCHRQTLSADLGGRCQAEGRPKVKRAALLLASLQKPKEAGVQTPNDAKVSGVISSLQAPQP